MVCMHPEEVASEVCMQHPVTQTPTSRRLPHAQLQGAPNVCWAYLIPDDGVVCDDDESLALVLHPAMVKKCPVMSIESSPAGAHPHASAARQCHPLVGDSEGT